MIRLLAQLLLSPEISYFLFEISLSNKSMDFLDWRAQMPPNPANASAIGRTSMLRLGRLVEILETLLLGPFLRLRYDHTH